jgi:hypothetical protein
MPLINGLDKAKLPDIRRAKGCLEWLYVGDNSQYGVTGTMR